ncbi:MAG: hypothetical protein ACLUE1_06735 [Adlercreutzia equolifaciens]
MDAGDAGGLHRRFSRTGLYVLSIVWVVRDAYLRGTVWYIWAVVALVPVLGLVAPCLLRPPLLQRDRDEQELESRSSSASS